MAALSVLVAFPECLSSRSVYESRGTRRPRGGEVFVTLGGAACDFSLRLARGRRLELPQRALSANQSVDAAAGRAMLWEKLKCFVI